MTLDEAVGIALIVFVKVFLMGFQSKNVVGNHYRAAFCTSILMGLLEVAMITKIAATGWPAVTPVALGGSVGIVTSMRLHSLLFPRPDTKR